MKIHVKRHETFDTNVNFVNEELLSMSPKIILKKLPHKISEIYAKFYVSNLDMSSSKEESIINFKIEIKEDPL